MIMLLTKIIFYSILNYLLFFTFYVGRPSVSPENLERSKIVNKGLRVFVAVAIGIFCGLAIMARATIAWRLLGMVSAGLIAYFGFAPVAALQAIPKAAASASQTLSNFVANCWRQRSFIKWSVAVGLAAISWVVLLATIFMAPSSSLRAELSIASERQAYIWYTSLVSAMIFSMCYWVSFGQQVAGLRKIALRGNPVVVLGYYLPLGVFKLTVFILRHLLRFLFWSLPRFLLRFIWHLFVLVHSQERLICMIDAMIGMVVAGQLLDINQWTARLLGALIGGLFGVFNYEVIAKRWLQLPQKQSAALIGR